MNHMKADIMQELWPSKLDMILPHGDNGTFQELRKTLTFDRKKELITKE